MMSLRSWLAARENSHCDGYTGALNNVKEKFILQKMKNERC